MDLSFVLGMNTRVNTAPITEKMPLMKNTPLLPRLVTRIGKA